MADGSIRSMKIGACPERLEAMLVEAWAARNAAFGAGVEWVSPFRTAVLSVTGARCSLACAHCGGRYLEHMLPIDRWREIDGSRVTSCLVSGGCDPGGRVPVADRLDVVGELASRWRLNLHLGVVGEEEVASLAGLSPVVSFDLVVDDATIREVYGLDLPGQKLLATYEMLRRYVRVVPHICIGLRGGVVSGELEALRALAACGADAIIFIVFTPTAGTRYASCNPPEPEAAAGVIAAARAMFPSTPLYLGCMRPRGEYRDRLDSLALRAGVNRIVSPSRKAIDSAEALGLVATWKEECCAL